VPSITSGGNGQRDREGQEDNEASAVGRGRLCALIAYGRKVFDLRKGFESVRDNRREPKVATALVAAAIFFCGLLRTRSFNALEPKLREKPFRRLLGAPTDGKSIGSADTLSRALRRIDLSTVQRLSIGIVEKAERNKVFREGWHGAMHAVAIDGWEPICSYNRHCNHCLIRNVRVAQGDGTVVEKDDVVEDEHEAPNLVRQLGVLLAQRGEDLALVRAADLI